MAGRYFKCLHLSLLAAVIGVVTVIYVLLLLTTSVFAISGKIIVRNVI